MVLANTILKMAMMLAGVVLLVAATCVTVKVYALVGELRAAVEENRPGIETVIREAKFAAFEVRGAFKAQREEWEDPDAAKARLAWLKAGYQLQGVLAKAENDLVPSLNDTAKALTGLTHNTDEQLTRVLLPQAALSLAGLDREIARTAAAFGTTAESVRGAVEQMARAGVADLEEIRSLLADPAWKKVLSETAGTAAEIHLAATSATRSMDSIEKSLGYAPGIMADFKAFTEAQTKYGKLVILARIIRALM